MESGEELGCEAEVEWEFASERGCDFVVEWECEWFFEDFPASLEELDLLCCTCLLDRATPTNLGEWLGGRLPSLEADRWGSPLAREKRGSRSRTESAKGERKHHIYLARISCAKGVGGERMGGSKVYNIIGIIWWRGESNMHA